MRVCHLELPSYQYRGNTSPWVTEHPALAGSPTAEKQGQPWTSENQAANYCSDRNAFQKAQHQVYSQEHSNNFPTQKTQINKLQPFFATLESLCFQQNLGLLLFSSNTENFVPWSALFISLYPACPLWCVFIPPGLLLFVYYLAEWSITLSWKMQEVL